ncbi:MAG: LysR family transcriptional regulator [Alphaproteobacteria bacterium]|nr:LysR family transcriptional regulator [Alphaproteobacteria bacterium]
MDLDRLRVFHAVAVAGSLTHAGEQLNLSQSAVSRQISALEDDLKVQLFSRHARGLLLTEQGERLHQTTTQIFEQLQRVEEQLLDSRETPRGDLRVTATVGIGSHWLAPRLRKFIELYPDIRIHLILHDGELDLVHREADVALRMRQPIQSDLIQRKLFDVAYHVYGSPDYIERKREPNSIDDLDRHDVIVYGDAPIELSKVNWLAEVGRKANDPRPAALYVNNIIAMGKAIEMGIGIGALPDYFTHGNDKLVRLMCQTPGPNYEVYLCYPESLRGSKRIGVFRDFLVSQARDWTF